MNGNNICQNFGYDTFTNGTHGCICQTGWVDQFCNTSLFQNDTGRLIGFDVFTGICAGYCGLLIVLSLIFIRQHWGNNSTKKDTRGPIIIICAALCLTLFMAVNPFGQRFPYNLSIFIFQTLCLNLAIGFTVCGLVFIICNWMTIAFITNGKITNKKWNTKITVVFFVLATIVVSAAFVTTGFGVFTYISTEIYLATIVLIILILSIILFISAVKVCKNAVNSRRAAKRALVSAIGIIISILTMIGIFVIRFLFKNSWELLFSFGLVIPAVIICFIQTIILFSLKYKNWDVLQNDINATMLNVKQINDFGTDDDNNDFGDQICSEKFTIVDEV